MTFDQPRGGHELIGAEPIVEAAFEQRSTPVQWPSARQSTDGANFGAACLTAASFRLIKGRTVSFCRASRRDITSESRTLAKTFGRPRPRCVEVARQSWCGPSASRSDAPMPPQP